ncbi:MAG TPA: hypothetical protein VMY77_18010 [Chitinophagaceae bacterium]|nr:hypothetical protein [Chitinophagaceae bacterium]
MRKILILVLSIAMGNAYGQGNTLYQVLFVTPKMGKAASYERTWKTHQAKFHAKDDGRQVYEVMSGDNAGSFILVSGPTSYADMDKEKANSAVHDADYDNTIIPFVEKNSGSYTYRWVDTLSYNGTVKAEKYVTTVYNLKQGKGPDLVAEIKRAIKINGLINSPSSYNTYIKLWAGSHPQIVTISNLKDGFKQLDLTYTPVNPAFKETYIKEYGQAQWDKRNTLLSEITESIDVYISKLRKDMSTAAK